MPRPAEHRMIGNPVLDADADIRRKISVSTEPYKSIDGEPKEVHYLIIERHRKTPKILKNLPGRDLSPSAKGTQHVVYKAISQRS
jgi:hypothetical protein